jgi:hypothetical protein
MDSINGTAASPVTIKATGSGAVVTKTTDRSDNRDTIEITFCSYIVLDGLTSFSANRAAVRIDNSPNITVKNGVFGNNTTWGIFTDFSDNLLIQSNTCYGSVQQHGVYVSNSCVNPTVRGNVSHDNFACGLHFNGDLSQGGVGLITGALVENNLLYNNGAGGGAAINMDGVRSSTIRNNLLYNNHAGGIALFQINGAMGPSGINVVYNTIDMASDGRWALLITNSDSGAGKIFVRDNILYNRNPNHGGIDYVTTTDVANSDSDNNIMDRITSDDGSTVFTLAQWQSQHGEPHSLSSTPTALFVNAGGGDYHLLSTAPAVGAGIALAGTLVDKDGKARPPAGASDIGCYELNSATGHGPSAYGYAGYVNTYYAYNYAYQGYSATGSMEAYLGFSYGYYAHYYATQAYYYDSGARQTSDYLTAYDYCYYCYTHSYTAYQATHNLLLYDAWYYGLYAYNDLYYAYLGY